MSLLKVFDVKGEKVGELEFADSLLVLDKGDQSVHDVVVATMAKRRQGSACTLTKGEVAGSGKKPWRQKGTGRARAGYKQSPVWRGGSVVFGPRPRSYEQKINKKVSLLAFKRVLSDKISNAGLIVIEDLVLPEIKTKTFVDVIKSLKIEGPVMFIVDKLDNKVIMSARNVKKTEVVDATSVDVYRLLRYSNIVVTKAGMKILTERMEKGLGKK